MMRRFLRVSAVAAVATFALTACGGDADPSGAWGVEGEGKPSLELAKDGKVSGTDGCNRLMSTWKQDGDKVTFTAVAGTMMACEGVDTWLSTMTSATIDGDTLVIKGEDGKKIGVLERP